VFGKVEDTGGHREVPRIFDIMRIRMGLTDIPEPARPPSESSAPWDPSLYQNAHAFVWEMAGEIFALLDPRPGERILDIGCGTGQLTARIAAAGAEVIGIDSSAEMLEKARANYPSIDFRQADARSFALGMRFDAVFSNAALHWAPEAEDVIRCVAAALRPGGRFVAEFGGKGNTGCLVEEAAAAAAARGISVHNPWYFPSIGEYSALLERNGFEVRHAALVDRPTKLEDGEDGLRRWMAMFGRPLLAPVPEPQRGEFLNELEARLRPHYYRDGVWTLPYRRLRIWARSGSEPEFDH
jgi:trans-aconitate methyltransferase